MNQDEINAMQAQDELTKEQQAVFFGQVIRALGELMAEDGPAGAPEVMKIHPRLYEQLFPAKVRFDPQTPKQCFTIPVEQEAGVPYGTFVFEISKNGIIRGH